MPNILIADDHDLVRGTIAAFLETISDFRLFTAPTLDEAMVIMGGDYIIDLAILDYNMPGMNGLKGLCSLHKKYPLSKVALMSGVASRDIATEAMANGADGFFPKSLSTTSMVNAIRFVLAGERFLPFEFSSNAPLAKPDGVFETLSGREMQTLEQLCNGLSNKEIARQLGIQDVTVKLHVKNLLSKLGVTNRTQAALMAKEKHIF